MASSSIATVPAWGNSSKRKLFPEDVTAIDIKLGNYKHSFTGRDAWCLARLIEAGEKGVTPIERPAPRWSHYVYKIRRAGLNVETITEGHRGAYSGTHARYRLQSDVEVLSVEVAQ